MNAALLQGALCEGAGVAHEAVSSRDTAGPLMRLHLPLPDLSIQAAPHLHSLICEPILPWVAEMPARYCVFLLTISPWFFKPVSWYLSHCTLLYLFCKF